MESATIMKILVLNMLLAFAVHADPALPPSSSPSTDIYSPSPSPFTDDSPAPTPCYDSPPQLLMPEVPRPSPATVLPPPPPQFPRPKEEDPVAPPPMSCKDQCFLKCAEKKGLSRWFCIGPCIVVCNIFSPSDHTGYQCAHDCVMNNLHHQPDIKSIDVLVNSCYNSCSKNV